VIVTRLHAVALAVYARIPTPVRWRLLRWLVPTYTVGAMCFVRRDDGAVLFVRQSYRQGWTVVGGSLSRHEEPAEAAVREAMEEVGLAIALDGPPAVVTYPERRDVHIVYTGRVDAGVDPGDVRPMPPEIVEAQWFAPDELPDLHPETARALLALRAMGVAI
jgi:8-oxo-dGTP pyrophosphatase MutT (NUDIX family)